MTQQSIDQRLTQELQAIIHDSQYNSLDQFVARKALDSDFPNAFFNDIFQEGIDSGQVSFLIPTNNSRAFFNYFYNEIENIRVEYESTNFGNTIQGDLRSYYARLAFVKTAEFLAAKLNFEFDIES